MAWYGQAAQVKARKEEPPVNTGGSSYSRGLSANTHDGYTTPCSKLDAGGYAPRSFTAARRPHRPSISMLLPSAGIPLRVVTLFCVRS